MPDYIVLQPSDLISDSRATINYNFSILDGKLNRFILTDKTLIGPPGIIFQGTYDSSITYTLGDGVLFNGSTYVSLNVSNTGNEPDLYPLLWQLTAVGGTIGATGPAGVGSSGAMGYTGAPGTNGNAGGTGATGAPSLIWLGNWNSIINYIVGDAVERNGSAYIAVMPNSDLDPVYNPTFWNLIASKGDTGVTGNIGASGTPGASGATGPAGQSLSYLGIWNISITYAILSMVNYSGQAYISITSGNTGLQPDLYPGNWAVITVTVVGATGSIGPQGATGATGAVGASGSPGGATGATGAGAIGATGAVGASGSPGGATGATGPVGASGSPGGGGSPSINDAVVQFGLNLGGSIAMQLNATAGNLLIVTVGYEGGTVPPVATTISDSLGSSFTMVNYTINGSLTAVFFAVLASSGANTITLGTGSWQRVGYVEVNGTWSTVDASGVANSPTAQVTATASGDFIYAATGGYHSASTISGGFPLQFLGMVNGSDCLGHGCYLAGAARVHNIYLTNSDPQPATVVVAFKYGATGATGAGATGATGPVGASGSPGGATGATGAIGATGSGGGGAGVSASSLGCTLDCDLLTGNKIGGGTATDNTTLLQAYISTACQTTPVHLIMDGPSLITGLQIPTNGYCTIDGLGYDTGFYLKSGCILSSAISTIRPGSNPGAIGDFIQLRNFYLNGNYSGNNGIYGIWIANTNHVIIENLLVTNCGYFNITIENGQDFVFDGITISGSNTVHQDGIHISGLCSDVRISNCNFYALGDDAIAINAPEGYGGSISRVTITNCTFYSTLTLARIYSIYSTPHTVDNVVISNCTAIILDTIGIASGVGIRIGNGGIGSVQDWVRHVSINNCRITGPAFMEFSDNCGDISVSDCTWTESGFGSFYENPAFIFVAASQVAHLNLNGFTIYRDVSGSVSHALLDVPASAIIDRLTLRGISIVNAIGITTGAITDLITIAGIINDLELVSVNPNLITNFSNSYTGIIALGGPGCSVFSFPDLPMKVGTLYLSSNAAGALTISMPYGPVRIGSGILLSGNSDPVNNPEPVQHTSGSGTSRAFINPVTIGNLLVVIARNNSSLANPTVMTDTLSNSWTQVAYGQGSNGTFPNQVSISTAIANASGSTTLSVASALEIALVEFSNPLQIVDAAAGTTRGVGGPPAPTLSLAHAYDLLITAATFDGSGISVNLGEYLLESLSNTALSWKFILSSGSTTSSLTAGTNTNQGYATVGIESGLSSPGTGNDGNWYLNTTTGVLWGPKTYGVWTAWSDISFTLPALPVLNNLVLVSDSSAPTGMEWRDVPTHSEPLTDGESNIIFADGDIVMLIGVPNS